MIPGAFAKEAQALAAAFGAVVMWGAVPVGTRFLVDGAAQRVDPVLLVALRFGLAALVFLPALLRARPWAWPASDRRRGMAAAALGVVGYNLPVALGQVALSASATALVIATEPLWILALWSLGQRSRPTAPQIAGSGVGVLGLGVLAAPAMAAPAMVGASFGAGFAWVLLGAFCWSAYCVLVAPLVQRHGALSVTASTIGLGSLPLVLIALPKLGQLGQIAGTDAALIALLAIASTVLATLAWNMAVARLPGPVCGQMLFAIPVVGLLAGHLVLAEPFGPRHWIALACIVSGLVLSQRSSRA